MRLGRGGRFRGGHLRTLRPTRARRAVLSHTPTDGLRSRRTNRTSPPRAGDGRVGPKPFGGGRGGVAWGLGARPSLRETAFAVSVGAGTPAPRGGWVPTAAARNKREPPGRTTCTDPHAVT